MLGSEAESMAVTTDGIEYQPGGLAHAVDLQFPVSGLDAVLAYAICGHAVRAWPNRPLDSTERCVDEECAVMARRD